MRIILFEISVDNDAGGFDVLRATSAHAGITVYDGHTWLPVVTAGPEISYSVWADGPKALAVDYGSITFNLTSQSGSNVWPRYSWEGALATIWVGDSDQPFSEFRKLYTGEVGPLERESATVGRVALLGSEAALDRDLLSATYAGTGGASGSAGVKGKFKPFAFGACLNVEPIEIDPVYKVYQVHGYGHCPINAVYERAMSLGAASVSVSSYAELIALTLADGQWAIAPSVGMFRLANEPEGMLTADIGASATVGQAARALMLEAGVSPARIASSVEATGRTTNFYATDQISIGELVRALAFDGSRHLITDSNGVFHFAPMVSTKPVVRLTSNRTTTPLVLADNIKQETPSLPAYRVRVAHSRVWAVHSSDDVSPAIADLNEKQANNEQAAQDAADAAAEADAKARQALAQYAAMAADGVLDRPEKLRIIERFEGYTQERAGLINEATNRGLTVERDAYQAAYDALRSYLEALVPAYTDTSSDTAIHGPTFNARFIGYDVARQALMNAIANAAAQTAGWAGVSGPGKPSDGATVGAPPGTEVGGRPSEEVVEAIDDIVENVVPNLRQIIADETTRVDGELDDARQELADARTTLNQAVVDARNELAGADDAIRQTIVSLNQTVGGNSAAITEEARLRTNADSAIAGRTTTLETNFSRIPETWKVYASGNGASRLPGLNWSGVQAPDGTLHGGYSRSYTVVVFALGSNTVESVRGFDVYGSGHVDYGFGVGIGNGDANSGSDAGSMARYLDSIAANKTVIVYTADEPREQRHQGGLLEAMRRIGAGERFESSSFRLHAAYILIGRAGVGRGGGEEFYAGDVDSSHASYLEVPFNLIGGRAAIGSQKGISQTNARVAAEEIARADGDSALSNRIQTVEASYVTRGSLNARDVDMEMRLDIPVNDAWMAYIDGSAVDERVVKSTAWNGESFLYIAPHLGQRQFFSKAFIEVDTSRRYRISTRIGAYATGGTGRNSMFWVGFVGYTANGEPIDHGSYGTWRYSAATGVNVTDGQLIRLSQIVTGEGNDSWVKFPPGTRKIRLMAIVNYENTADVNSYIDYIRFEDVDEAMRVDARVTDQATATANSIEAIGNRQTAIETSFTGSSLGGGNLLANTDFITEDGWNRYNALATALQFSINLAGDLYHPPGENVFGVRGPGPTNAGSYMGYESTGFPVKPGERMQAYVWANAHRAYVGLVVYFHDINGNYVGVADSGQAAMQNSLGYDPNQYNRVGIQSFTVPAGGVRAYVQLRKFDTLAGHSDSYAWFWRPYVGVIREGQSGWNPFAHGSARAQITQTNARITNEETARVNADSALAGRSSTLEAMFRREVPSDINNAIGAVDGRVTSEANARANADGALAGRADTLEAKMAGGQDSWLAARIRDEATASANRDTAIGTRVGGVEARAGDLESRTSINETAIVSANGRLAAARLELTAVSPGGRAQVVIRSDNNSGAGVDIVGDVSISGDLVVGGTISTQKIALEAVNRSVYATLTYNYGLNKFTDNYVLSVTVPDVVPGELLKVMGNFSLYADNDLTGNVTVRMQRPDGNVYNIRSQQMKLDSDGNTATYLTLPVVAREIASQAGTYTFWLGYRPTSSASVNRADAGTDLEVTVQKR